MLKPKKVGLVDGKFHPCPKKHYCVSTQCPEDDEVHYIKPIPYSTSKEEAIENIIKIITSMKRTKILKQTDNYIHSLFTTTLFRFKDDVEFLFDDNAKLIHFRSQSRIGGYDYGTNRNRMEMIRKLYEKTL